MELYPNFIDSSNTDSPGEIIFFDKIKNLKDSKNIVFHSLDVREHISNFMGEIDFLMIVPGKGVLTIEIKSHKSISFDKNSGFWKLGNDAPEKRGPFKQARDNRISLREKLVNKFPTLKEILFWDLVIFTGLEVANQFEWNKWEYMDARDFHLSDQDFLAKIELTLETAFNINKDKLPIKSDQPNDNQIGILRQLRKNIEIYLSPKHRIQSQEKELHKIFTQNQYKYLDLIAYNKKIILEGPAGTGKTLLAIETIRRLNIQSKRILFLCFNSLLQQYLSDQLQSLENVFVSTYANFVKAITNKNLDSVTQDEILLNVLEIKEEKKFDAIVIDEAQDILDENTYDILDSLSKNGIQNANCYIFGDFEHQKIQNIKNNFDLNKFNNKSQFFLIKLQENCRNLPDVLEVAKIFCKTDPYTKVLRTDENSQPITRPYESDEDQLGNLASIILELDKEFKREEITILTMKTIQESIYKYYQAFPIFNLLNDIPNKYSTLKYDGKFNFDSKRFNFSNHIDFTTIRKFKGLENNVIIITDVDDLNSDLQRNILHTGITRTKQKIIILFKKGIKLD